MGERECEYCGKPLGPLARPNKRYCSNSHRVMAVQDRRMWRQVDAALDVLTRDPAVNDVTLTSHDGHLRFTPLVELTPGEFTPGGEWWERLR
jgi:hypothetical protein